MHYLHGSEKLQSSNTTHRGHRPLFPQLQLQMRPSDNLENKTLYQSKYEKNQVLCMEIQAYSFSETPLG